MKSKITGKPILVHVKSAPATEFNIVTFTCPPHLCKASLSLIPPLQDIQGLALWGSSRQRTSVVAANERAGDGKIETDDSERVHDVFMRSVGAVIG